MATTTHRATTATRRRRRTVRRRSQPTAPKTPVPTNSSVATEQTEGQKARAHAAADVHQRAVLVVEALAKPGPRLAEHDAPALDARSRQADLAAVGVARKHQGDVARRQALGDFAVMAEQQAHRGRPAVESAEHALDVTVAVHHVVDAADLQRGGADRQ